MDDKKIDNIENNQEVENQNNAPLTDEERAELEALRKEKESQKDRVTCNLYDRVNASPELLGKIVLGGCLVMVFIVVIGLLTR